MKIKIEGDISIQGICSVILAATAVATFVFK